MGPPVFSYLDEAPHEPCGYLQSIQTITLRLRLFRQPDPLEAQAAGFLHFHPLPAATERDDAPHSVLRRSGLRPMIQVILVVISQTNRELQDVRGREAASVGHLDLAHLPPPGCRPLPHIRDDLDPPRSPRTAEDIRIVNRTPICSSIPLCVPETVGVSSVSIRMVSPGVSVSGGIVHLTFTLTDPFSPQTEPRRTVRLPSMPFTSAG